MELAPSAVALPGTFGCLRGAWRTMTDDPLGILLPTGGLLLADALLFELVRQRLDDPVRAVALLAARPLLHAPFRARLVAVAARLQGRTATSWGRPAALVGAELVSWPLVVAVWCACAAAGVAAAGFAASEGWFASASVLVAGGCLAGSGLALVLRALFAYVPWEVAVEGRSSVGALVASARRGPADTAVALSLLAFGDTLVLSAGLACGALLLPGYPLATLAVVVRAAGAR